MTVFTQGPECNNGNVCCCDACTHDKIGCVGECCRCVPRILCVTFTPDDPAQCSAVGMFVINENLGTYSGTFSSLFGYTDTTFTVSLLKGDYSCSWVLDIPDLGIYDEQEIDGVYVTCGDILFNLTISSSYCPGTLVISRYDLAKVPFLYVADEIVGPCINTATWEANIVPSADCTGPGCNYVGVSDPSAPLGMSWQLTSGSCDAPCACQPDGFLSFPRQPDFPGDTLSVPCAGFSDPGAEWLPVSESNPSCCAPSEPPSFNGVIDGDIQTTECTSTALGTIFPHSCGACATVCGQICVQYQLNGELIRKTFEWDESTSRWVYTLNLISDYIILAEDEYGNCEILFDIQELADAGYLFELQPITLCGLTLDSTFTDVYDSIAIRISCNPCTCWEHLCGTCRCACSELCVVLYDQGIATLYELPWSFNSVTGEAGWTDGYFTVTLSRDSDTRGCLITVPGFDPVAIDSCGTAIGFALTDYEGDFRGFVRCKNCLCELGPALCCDTDLDALPLVLTATISNVSDCSCAGSTVALYWNPFGEHWDGTGSLGGCYYPSSIRILLSCVGSGLSASVSYCCGDDGLGNQLCENPASTVTLLSCHPVHATLSNIIVDRSCCEDEPMAGGVLGIEITE